MDAGKGAVGSAVPTERNSRMNGRRARRPSDKESTRKEVIQSLPGTEPCQGNRTRGVQLSERDQRVAGCYGWSSTDGSTWEKTV
jgi:hypothetical protein